MSDTLKGLRDLIENQRYNNPAYRKNLIGHLDKLESEFAGLHNSPKEQIEEADKKSIIKLAWSHSAMSQYLYDNVSGFNVLPAMNLENQFIKTLENLGWTGDFMNLCKSMENK